MTVRRILLFRVAISLVVVLSISGLLYMAVPAIPFLRKGLVPAEGLLFLGISTSIVLASSAVIVGLLLRSAHSQEGRALAVMLAGLAYGAGAGEAIYQLRQQLAPHSIVDAALDFTVPLSLLVAIASLLRFTALFPRQLTAERLLQERVLPRLRAAILNGRTLWASVLTIAVVAEASVLAAVHGRQHFGLALPSFPFHKLVFIGLMLLGLTICVANLRTGYQHSDEQGRRRIYWVLEGLLAGTVVLALASALKLLQMGGIVSIEASIWYPLAVLGALLLIILFLGVAMFYAGAFDPALAIRRTATTGLVGVAMVFIFAITQQLVQELLVSWVGLSDRAGGMATGGIVALSFEPVQRRLNGAVTRWVSRPRTAGEPLAVPAPAAGGAAHA